MDDTGAPAFHLIRTDWLRPTVLELADNHPGWDAKQIAAKLERSEPERAPISAEAVQAVLDAQTN